MDYGTISAIGDLRPKTTAGNVRYVGPNCTYTTIQAAITASSAGDTILVAPGTYTEAITYSVDNLVIKAIGSYLDTIITQAAATVVDMSTKSGCVLEGFTVSVTAATTTLRYCVLSANDDTTAYNYVRSCNLTWASSTLSIGTKVVNVTDGNFEITDSIISHNQTYAGSSESYVYTYCLSFDGTGHTLKMYRNKVILNVNTGYAWFVIAISANSGSNIVQYIQNNDITVVSNNTDTARCDGILLGTNTNAFIMANKIKINSVNSISRGIINSYGTVDTFGNNISVVSSSGSAASIRREGGVVNSYGDILIAGGFTDDGTGATNIYGTPKAGDVGYGVVSSGTTGGSGTAATGKNYVNVVINGTTRKLFYDTAA